MTYNGYRITKGWMVEVLNNGTYGNKQYYFEAWKRDVLIMMHTKFGSLIQMIDEFGADY